MIDVLFEDFNQKVRKKFKSRNDKEYINACRRYMHEALDTIVKLSEGARDSTDDHYQKFPFNKTADAINVLLYNHLDGDNFETLMNGSDEDKKELTRYIRSKHTTFTV